MSYTIQATPAAYSSVHDDLVYTVADAVKTADPVTYPNFKFIGDVYIGGVIQARIKKVPDPATGIGVFNIGQIVRNYLATIFNPVTGALIAQQLTDGQFRVTVTMQFGEEYAFTDFLNLVVDSARTYFNNYNGRLIGTTSSLIPFTDKVATNRPNYLQTLLSSQYNLISYFPTSTAPVPVVVTPLGGGSGFSTTFTPGNALDMQILNISPGALNGAHAGAINAATLSYAVQIGAQTWVVTIICEPIYQPRMLHFLNQYGGFDSKIFSKVSRKTYTITKTDFGKLRYSVDGSGNVSYKNGNGVYNESRSVYSSQFIEDATLNTDNLTDAEYVWLQDLLFSPMIYIEDGGYLFPCVISASVDATGGDITYETKKSANDDLSSLTIDIQYGNQLNAQFR